MSQQQQQQARTPSVLVSSATEAHKVTAQQSLLNVLSAISQRAEQGYFFVVLIGSYEEFIFEELQKLKFTVIKSKYACIVEWGGEQ